MFLFRRLAILLSLFSQLSHHTFGTLEEASNIRSIPGPAVRLQSRLGQTYLMRCLAQAAGVPCALHRTVSESRETTSLLLSVYQTHHETHTSECSTTTAKTQVHYQALECAW
jgi:hypothetical protein